VLPSIKEFFQMLLTFFLAVFGWIIFRAKTIAGAWDYICGIFNKSLFTKPVLNSFETIEIVLIICLFLIIEWRGRNDQFALETFGLKWKRVYRLLMYYLIFFLIFWFHQESQQFIYFQF
jgi:alginate O-acetyltransferase complex protein AlgI